VAEFGFAEHYVVDSATIDTTEHSPSVLPGLHPGPVAERISIDKQVPI
jgi:hypothetical protein